MRWKRSMAQKLQWCTVSSVTLCKIPPHHSVFVHLTQKVCQLTIKRDKSWLQFFPIGSPLCFFREATETEREGWTDGEKPHHITTPQALMETCRLLRDRSTHGLRLPWEPGYMASWTDTDVFAFAQVWTLSDRYVSTPKREGWKRGNLSCLHPSTPLWS